MAITRAQQFKQMLQDGGRIGFKKGRDLDYQQRGTDRQTYSATQQQQNFSARKDDSPQDNKVDVGFQEALRKQKIKQKQKTAQDAGFRTSASTQYVPPSKFQQFRNKSFQNAINRNKVAALRELGLMNPKSFNLGAALFQGFEKLPEMYQDLTEEEINDLAMEVNKMKQYSGGTLSMPTVSGIMKSGQDLLGKVFEAQDLLDQNKLTQDKFQELFPGPPKARDDDGPSDPCLGPNPPAYCFTGIRSVEPEEEDPSSVFAQFGITPRIAGSQFAAEGGRIGYDDGGMLVQPGFGGTRQGYRSAKAQESKQQSAQEYKASTTQQQRDDDRREFQEQRKQAVQRLEQVRPTSTRKKGIENAVRTASELNYLRNLYKLDPVGLGLSFIGNKVSDFLFPPAGASELSEDELNILRATGQLENQKQKILDATGIGSGAEVGPVPDLTDPKVAGGIAEAGGLTTGLKKVGGKEIFGTTIGGEQIRVPTDLSQQAIEEIQRDKRQLGLTRDQVIDKALDFDYPTSITEEGAGTIYDMVQADQLPRTLAAEGGIMDLGRQELFLGGIAKGLKKAARGVSRTLKKVAKSPIGKAAILGAIGFGIPGTSFGGLLGRASLGGAAQGAFGTFGPKSALQKLGIMKSIGDAGMAPARIGPFAKLFDSPLGLITLASLGSGFFTKKQKDDDLDLAALYGQPLVPATTPRQMGSILEGYRYNVAEGGMPEKEPVAKKTMPLLDMDGQEMDLRAEGGFVPIGRMEKADDVPARLSKNEFVFTADAVRNAGDGDVDKGAEVMYNMMKNLERGGNVSDESQGLEGAREMFQTSKRLEEVL